MDGQVSAKTKTARRDSLLKTQAEISLRKNEAKVGQLLEVIIDGAVPYEKNTWVGRSYADCPEADGVIFVKSKKPLKSGEFADIIITEADEYDLIGVLQ
jgi:ribosomal protein S12 methylthiotransferase